MKLFRNLLASHSTESVLYWVISFVLATGAGLLAAYLVYGLPTQDLFLYILASFVVFAAMLFAVLFYSGKDTSLASLPLLDLVESLMETKEQTVIMTMPVHSSGHINLALNLCGLLNQFGREAIVLDVDLKHRLLSRKLPVDHPEGIYEHLTRTDLRKPLNESLSGAKVIPLETALEADRVVEYSQVVQRLPGLWQRWGHSVVILDISQWHEAYHQLLPAVSNVVFYMPPDHQSTVLFPQLFLRKYKKKVSLVEIQSEF